MARMKSEYLPSTRIKPSLKRKFEKYAAEQEETLTEFIRRSVEERIDRIERKKEIGEKQAEAIEEMVKDLLYPINDD